MLFILASPLFSCSPMQPMLPYSSRLNSNTNSFIKFSPRLFNSSKHKRNIFVFYQSNAHTHNLQIKLPHKTYIKIQHFHDPPSSFLTTLEAATFKSNLFLLVALPFLLSRFFWLPFIESKDLILGYHLASPLSSQHILLSSSCYTFITIFWFNNQCLRGYNYIFTVYSDYKHLLIQLFSFSSVSHCFLHFLCTYFQIL